jgi:large subunit ribosomal protein L13
MNSSTGIRPSQIQRKWHVIDVSDQTLGRISSQIAKLLIGKHKPYFVNHQDTGDYVVVINAAKVKTTGNKLETKTYYRHSGYPGGMKTRSLGEQMNKDSRVVLEKAIKGMLPRTKLGAKMFTKLFVYADDKHPYMDKIEKGAK